MGATIHLVRHGTHDLVAKTLCGRREGVGLGEAGRSEARAVAKRLAGASLTAVYSSPLERTQETAAIIGEACALPVIVEDALIEIDFGAWAGLTFSELDQDPSWREWNADRGRAAVPGGESMAHAQLRVATWLRTIGQRHAGESVAAVSHGDVIKSGVAHILGLPLHFYDRFDIAPGSITTLHIGGEGMKVSALNEVAHE
ncbi:histidine phosphatase family protein [Hansschlegelia quercus]|uniref:Histidine phosphatase family protein n=1 Tax=Hansschlegelia quercus TaxID=2528245 RepID=A0A4Q9GMF1_9HYPH|nr:histidine phosphatase family protein [Hansschlegelia quercus]